MSDTGSPTSVSPLYNLLKDLGLNEKNIIQIHEIEYHIDPILSWIPAVLPNYTDHGKLHTYNLLDNILKVLNQYPIKLEELEKKLLIVSAFLHDIGCILGRENHNFNSIKILNKYYKKWLIDEYSNLTIGEYNCIEQIIVSHSKKFDFNNIIDYPDTKIRLQLLCAIFRLCDALDYNSRRINNILYDVLINENILDEESNKIWLSHKSIQNIEIKETEIIIWINNFENPYYCVENLRDELEEINKLLKNNDCDQFKLTIKSTDIKYDT
jgi:hypothetical protein